MTSTCRGSLALLILVIPSTVALASGAGKAATLRDEAATRTHCARLAEDFLHAERDALRAKIEAGMAPMIADFEEEAARISRDTAGWATSGVPSLGEQMRVQMMRSVDFILDRLRRSSPLDQEYVSTQRLGTSFVRHTHVLRFEKEGWRLDCTYYRGKDGWHPRPALPSSETIGDVFSAPAPASRPAR
jgi:hypothetical protein